MSDIQIVKYCPACGHENLPRESFCTECDFDLMHVLAEPRRVEGVESATDTELAEIGEELRTHRKPVEADTCRLELLDNAEIAFQIRPGQSVGRGVEADILLAEVPHLGYISRRHAVFSRRGEQWFVQYAASGNFIKVDGDTYDDDSLVALHDGSILTLSLTSFRVVLA